MIRTQDLERWINENTDVLTMSYLESEYKDEIIKRLRERDKLLREENRGK